MRLICLVHPTDRVEFLEGIEDISNTYCFGFGDEHDIVIDTDVVAYHHRDASDVVAATAMGKLYVTTQVGLVVKYMQRDGTLDEYRFYKILETCPNVVEGETH